MRGKKVFAITAVVLPLLAGCHQNQNKDLKGVSFIQPDSVQGYKNVDGYPNLVIMCVKGVAFASTQRDAQAAMQRVPELDRTCPGYAGK